MVIVRYGNGLREYQYIYKLYSNTIKNILKIEQFDS